MWFPHWSAGSTSTTVLMTLTSFLSGVSHMFSSSELGLSRLEVLDGLESRVARVLDHLLGLPVGREDSPVTDANRGHLESKEVDVGLHCRLAHRVASCVEDATVLEEAAREASEDDDFVLGDLNDAGTLALRELGRGDVDDYPGVRSVQGVVSLDTVAVLFARLGNTAEDENESLVVGG